MPAAVAARKARLDPMILSNVIYFTFTYFRKLCAATSAA